MRDEMLLPDPDTLNKIRATRTLYGLTQKEFAEALQVSLRTLQGWEQNRRSPQGPARRLLKLFRLRPDFFLGVIRSGAETERKSSRSTNRPGKRVRWRVVSGQFWEGGSSRRRTYLVPANPSTAESSAGDRRTKRRRGILRRKKRIRRDRE